METAQELAATHEFDDPDGFPAVPDEVNVVYEGGVVEDFAGSQQEQEQALVAAIRARADPGACAVLCASNWAVIRWLQVLSRAGLSTQNLDDYDGRPTTCVKVGTFFRVKGLGFKHVFLPDWTAYPDPLGTEDRESVAPSRVRRPQPRSRLGLAWLKQPAMSAAALRSGELAEAVRHGGRRILRTHRQAPAGPSESVV